MTWAPFALAIVFGLLVSAGIYFTVMWPDVAPDDEADAAADDDAAAIEDAVAAPEADAVAVAVAAAAPEADAVAAAAPVTDDAAP